MRLIPQETAAKNDVRLAFNDRAQQARELPRVVFEVGVLNNHHVPRCMSEARA